MMALRLFKADYFKSEITRQNRFLIDVKSLDLLDCLIVWIWVAKSAEISRDFLLVARDRTSFKSQAAASRGPVREMDKLVEPN